MLDVRKNGRRKPNKIALGMEKPLSPLNITPAVLDRIKYSGQAEHPAAVNENVLAQLFGVDRVVVLASSYNKEAPGADADMSFVCDPAGMLICYAPRSARNRRTIRRIYLRVGYTGRRSVYRNEPVGGRTRHS